MQTSRNKSCFYLKKKTQTVIIHEIWQNKIPLNRKLAGRGGGPPQPEAAQDSQGEAGVSERFYRPVFCSRLVGDSDLLRQ